jgi:hypothetical protein
MKIVSYLIALASAFVFAMGKRTKLGKKYDEDCSGALSICGSGLTCTVLNKKTKVCKLSEGIQCTNDGQCSSNNCKERRIKIVEGLNVTLKGCDAQSKPKTTSED